MEKRAEIKVHGRVQKAGFRDLIDEIAFNLNLNGYVKNLDDGTVQVICEGEEAAITEFLKKINITQYPIRVKNIEVIYKEPTREYKTFEVIRDEDLTAATYERMDAAARYIREMNSNLCQKMDVLGGKMDSLGGKIDTLGGKIDVLGGKMDSLGGKIDILGNKIDYARVEITSEIRLSRNNFKSHLDERVSVIEREIALIKSKVIT